MHWDPVVYRVIKSGVYLNYLNHHFTQVLLLSEMGRNITYLLAYIFLFAQYYFLSDIKFYVFIFFCFKTEWLPAINLTSLLLLKVNTMLRALYSNFWFSSGLIISVCCVTKQGFHMFYTKIIFLFLKWHWLMLYLILFSSFLRVRSFCTHEILNFLCNTPLCYMMRKVD